MSANLATDRQRDYLLALVNQVVNLWPQVDAEHGTELANFARDTGSALAGDPALTRTHASTAIDGLKERLADLRSRRPQGAAQPDTVEPGFYFLDSTVYRVVWNQPKTRTYAKRLNPVTGQWTYAGGVVGQLIDTLTVEQAAALGRQYGRCCYCGKELADALSVERGIGPVCWNKHVA
jgi:hypothetical protein